MIGYIRCVREKGQVPIEVDDLYGIRVMTASLFVPNGARLKATHRKLTRIIRVFQKNMISRIIIPQGFPYREQLRCFKEVDELELYRSVADVLALGWLEIHGFAVGRSCVALTEPRISPELENTARRLCRSVRGVCIEVPGVDGDLFATELQRDYGIPVTPRGAPSDLTVEFGPTEKRGQLRLWGEQPYLDGLQLHVEGIELPRELLLPILTLLWERGKLRRQQLHVVCDKK